MKKRIYLRLLSFLLAFLLAVPALCLTSCDNEEVVAISFSDAISVEEMRKYNGKRVSIIGYMSTLSPVNGEFIYLMNMPYQSCPFCIPNTSTLSNTLAVYAKDGKSFEFTDLLIRVEGTLEFGDYTDEYGYEYVYRIMNASYTTVDSSDMGERIQLWQELASEGAIADVYSMYDYVKFVCMWGTYTASFDGQKDYLYPSDVSRYIEIDGAQFNYGYVDGYFDGLISRIEAIDKTAFSELTDNIRKAEALANDAVTALKNGEYTASVEYSDAFGDGRIQYKLNAQDDFIQRYNEALTEFLRWFEDWEL